MRLGRTWEGKAFVTAANESTELVLVLEKKLS